MGTSIIHANHIVSLPKAGNFDRYWPDPSCKPLGTSTKSPMTKHNPTVQKYFQLQSSGHFGNASCGCPSGCICWSLDLTTPKRLLWQKWVHTPTDLAAPGNMHSWWLPRTKRLHLSFKISVPHQKHMSLNACLYIYISAHLAQHNLICAQSTSTGRQQKITTTCSATLPTRRDVCSRPRLSSNAAHSDLTHCSCRSERQSQPNTGVPLAVIHLYTSSKK